MSRLSASGALLAIALVAVLLPTTASATTVSGAEDAGPASVQPVARKRVVKVRLRRAVKRLRVAAERPRGYDREKFPHWIDANGDCEDTRAEVLVQESRRRTTGDCTIRTGRWLSYYDRRRHTDAGDLDIDHLVPLAEAWRSGARRWTTDTRRRFANDLRDRRTLVAVTAGVNRSKSDRDPSDWMPRYHRCRYVRHWTIVKTRWSLRVNRAEKRTLRRHASRCKNVQLTVRKAAIKRRSSTRNWYPPVSRYRCPSFAPIKGNESSMLYHLPSSPWYAATTPEKCFRTEAAARAAGFRRAG